MGKMQQLIMIIKKIIKEENEKNVHLRGGKGYGASHPYPVKSEPLPIYGEIVINDQVEKDEEPVKISKAFKKD